MWFFQVEAQFSISDITSEETKFNYLVAQLEPKFMEIIWHIIKDTSKNDSTTKNRLLQTFKEIENQLVKRLLTEVELGDMKPSQLLRKMKSLGLDISDRMPRILWMDKMPDAVKNILIVSEEDIDKLTTMADKIIEMNLRSELAAVSNNNPSVAELLQKISSRELQIANLSGRNSRRRNRSSSRNATGEGNDLILKPILLFPF